MVYRCELCNRTEYEYSGTRAEHDKELYVASQRNFSLVCGDCKAEFYDFLKPNIEFFKKKKDMERKVYDFKKVVSHCIQDMGNTAVANQRNLDGTHPFLGGEPQEYYIGDCAVSENGIGITLTLIEECRSLLAESK